MREWLTHWWGVWKAKSSPRKSLRPLVILRRSLALRMASITMVVGIGFLVTTLLLVTTQISRNVFSSSLENILEDANLRVTNTQTLLDSSDPATADEVAFAAQTQLTQMKESSSGAGGIGVVLNRSSKESSSTIINNLTTATELRSLITDEMVAQVEEGGIGHQYWQSVLVPTDAGGSAPGIIVGTQVSLPLAGIYDLFLVYSLESEQNTLNLATRAVTIGSSVLVLLLIVLAWALTWRVLLPVRQTSLAAQRLASGLLSERLQVSGEDELALLAVSFNNMADSIEVQIDRLRELSRLQQRFVSDVSHELRTPLTTIRLAGEQLFEAREDFDDPILKRSAELLSSQIERFDRMLSDLLEISRFDSGAAVLKHKEQDLLETLDGVLVMAAPLAREKGSEIRLHLPEGPVIATFDERRIERVIRNLLVNALEHGEGKPIDITVGVDERSVAVRVRDHGIGMSPEVAEHVFDRFFRADPSRARTTGGTGLGLSISLEDTTLHNGKLSAWGEPGEGAAFRLLLPLREGENPGTGPFTAMPQGTAALLSSELDELTEMETQPVEDTPADSPIAVPVAVPATRWADETGAFPVVAPTADEADDDEPDPLPEKEER